MVMVNVDRRKEIVIPKQSISALKRAIKDDYMIHNPEKIIGMVDYYLG